MENSDIYSTIDKYLYMITSASSFEEKINILFILNDVIEYKLLYSTERRLMELVDSYKFLQNMMKSRILGAQADAVINEWNTLYYTKGLLTKLTKKYTEQKCTESLYTICLISNLRSEKDWVIDIDVMEEFLLYISKNLAVKQEKESFEICECLSHIIPSLSSDLLQKSWPKYLYEGLYNMILSKLSPTFLNKALKLAKVVLSSFEINWLVNQDNGKKLFITIVNLACIQIRMCLESKTFEDIEEKNYAELQVCYAIVEMVSQYLLCESTTLTHENVVQLNAALKEVSGVIICFIKGNLHINYKSNIILDLFTILTIKCIGVLMEEESRINGEDFIQILPFFMDIVRYQFNVFGNEQLLSYIMPGLCNLTSNELFLETLLKLNLEKILFSYVKQQWNNSKHKEIINKSILSQKTDTILMTFNVILNVITFGKSDRILSEEVYFNTLEFIFVNINEIPKETEFMQLSGIFCTVGTLILERKYNSYMENDDRVVSFMQSVITFLWGVFETSKNVYILNSAYKPIGGDVIDFWLLTMNNLLGLIENSSWIASFCIDSEWPSIFAIYIAKHEKSIEVDVKNSFNQVFSSLSKFQKTKYSK